MADYGMSDVATFITRERGDKGLSLKQEDFQLVVANSIQLPLGGWGVGVALQRSWKQNGSIDNIWNSTCKCLEANTYG